MKALWITSVFVALLVLVTPFVSSKNTTVDTLPGVQQVLQTHSGKSIRLTFAGDIMLDRYIRTTGEPHGYTNTVSGLAPFLTESDFVVANLEGPVTSYPSKSNGTAPAEMNNFVFTFSPDALRPLYDSGLDAVSIGNNHILNFGGDGLAQTTQYLQEVGIAYFGEPFTQNILVQNIGDISVGFLAFNEFFPFDEKQFLEEIQSVSHITDFTVIYAHWGSEYETTPNTLQQRLAHRFIDAGADVVIGTHPHVIQSKEVYDGKMIFYSLGNFIFDQYWSADVRCGALVTLTITPPDMAYTADESFVWLEKDGTTATSSCLGSVPTLLPST